MAEESDDFYEFTAEDYYRVIATKKEGKNCTSYSTIQDVRLYLH